MTRWMGSLLLRQQRASLDVPRDVVYGAVGGQNGRLAGSESQSDQSLAGDFEVGLALGSDLHDAAFSGQRSGDVDVAFDIESQALRTSQSAVKHGHGSVRVDLINAVEAGRAGTGDEHVSVGAEREVIGSNARLERREHENLAVARDLENRSAAVADVEIFFAIEGNSGGDSHAFGVGGHGAIGRDFVDSLVVPR